MHVMKFIGGMLIAVLIVVVAAWMQGWSGWAILGIAVATAVIAQVFFVLMVAGMAAFRSADKRSETRPAQGRRKVN
jgi:cytochrome bd-type quinol oxidase subunit 1